MFHEMICNRCDGSGVIAISGETIDRDTLVVHMKMAIKKLREQNRQLQIENKRYREKFGDHEAAGHFEDLKIVNCGRYRGD
jgi:regulator of replication initiation timing